MFNSEVTALGQKVADLLPEIQKYAADADYVNRYHMRHATTLVSAYAALVEAMNVVMKDRFPEDVGVG